MHALEKKILLASKSPRRKQLLELAGFSFQVIDVDVEETYPATMPVADVAPFLARKKALAAKPLLRPGHVILTADSVVILHGKIYEKPADKEAARQMLSDLSGQVHEVITGVCLLSENREAVFSGSTMVHFQELSPAEIDFYIDTYGPFDKAGSYGVQEWIGLCKIHRIEGTYANVMGLPVDLVYEQLQQF